MAIVLEPEKPDAPFTIPATIQIAHKTIQVKMRDDLVFEEDKQGIASQRRNEIWIQANCDGWAMSHEDTVETYIHEVLHFVLNATGYPDQSSDEMFVGRMSRGIAQAILTAKGSVK